MPIISPTIFAPAAVYYGDQSSSSVLTYLTTLRTGGFSVSEEQPGNYVEVLQNVAQSGTHKIKFNLTFISDDPNVTNLLRGLPNGSNINAVPQKNLSTILVLSPNQYTQTSYLFYYARPVNAWNATYRKQDVAAITAAFVCERRNINDQIFYKDTTQNLKAYLGSRSPI